MQALTIWHSCLIPQLNLELCSSRSSVKWVAKRGLKSGTGVIGTKSEFNGKLYCLCSKGAIDFLFKPRKCAFHAAFALTWALAEPEVGIDVEFTHAQMGNNQEDNDDVGKSGIGDDNQEDDNDARRSGIGDDNQEDDNDAQRSGVGDAERARKGNSERVDVRALAYKLHSAKTADDVEEVLKGNEKLPLQVFSTIIRGLGKEKRLDSVMALFKWLKRKSKETDSPIRLNLFIYNNLLGTLKHAQNFDLGDEILNDMATEGLHPNIVTYNTLMGIHIEQGREVKALQLFEEMPTKGVTPSPASYSTVIFAYRRLEDGFKALSFFVEIRNKYQEGEIGKDGDSEDWDHEFAKLQDFTARVCYQVMRRWIVRSENLSTEVLRLLTEMDKVGLQPSVAENERLIWACTREEHYLVIKELYARVRETDAGISLSVCNHVIWLMGKAKKWWAALEVYEDLLDKGLKPNNMSHELIVSHFNILLNAARKKGIWRWGTRLLNKMEEKGLKPGSREWNSVLVACSKASETEAAIEIFKRMVESGEKPTIISYGALLSALEKGKLYDEALQVWKHMMKVGVELNLYAYTIMVSIYAGQGKFDIVDSIIREMVTVGVEPTVVTFNAIISCCARNSMGSVAYEWFERMKVQNITPNEITYEMLIEALANDGKPRIGYELYLRALNEGLELSAKAYDAVVRSSEMYGATIDVDTLGPRPPEKKIKVQVQARKNMSEFSKFADVPRRSKPFERSEIYMYRSEELHT